MIAAAAQERSEAVSEYFYLVEESAYRRSVLLAEADRDRRLAAVPGVGLRHDLAALLIDLAVWLAPASANARGRVALHDERAVARIARI